MSKIVSTTKFGKSGLSIEVMQSAPAMYSFAVKLDGKRLDGAGFWETQERAQLEGELLACRFNCTLERSCTN